MSGYVLGPDPVDGELQEVVTWRSRERSDRGGDVRAMTSYHIVYKKHCKITFVNASIYHQIRNN